MDFTDWDFVRKSAPVIFTALYPKEFGVQLESDVAAFVNDSIDIAIEMSKAIARRKDREMEDLTGLPTPKKAQNQGGKF
ncbi:hypothetical protein PJF56_10645 [Roseofilum sp. BLCC_M91]|uniref:Uncharacterized protein n=1 Tax=Roseofilum halophilum BLCC-M91 TaxID=3022259 RepID=A0ABT7BJG2_9CYAN|nr:hypothetical protein [Roseofilum halophilum]MDJ1179323.1 hypothetical protein [Roseofilum halophilum BLCC-M91]